MGLGGMEGPEPRWVSRVKGKGSRPGGDSSDSQRVSREAPRPQEGDVYR